MTAATNHSIAFRLGRASGAVVRFCLFDKNSLIRWGKRVVVFTTLALILTNSLSAIISLLLSVGCFGLLVWALSTGNSSLLSGMLKEDVHARGTDDDSYRAPFYGEHEHPDYNMHFKD
ncbi:MULTISPECIES: hypothetical protein [Pseudomonas]|uniref:hypothetical protein n=1 Tax=Pseudomonas TaxID=286 RepID=UPI0003DC91EC|nr:MULTISPECIES: hypothetical protein [Pseudomonas]ETK22742.1 hypothetical protein H096_14233 [Pseudomonas sp. FH1]MDB1111885.1 hypothetical protein [Pseudomonas extremaustralis]